MHKIPEHLVAVTGKLFKSIVRTGVGSIESKRRSNANVGGAGGGNEEDDEDDTIILDPLTTIMRLATLHLRPQGTKLSFTKHSMLFDLPTTPIHWQGIWRTISFFSGIHSCRNDLSVLKNSILAFRISSSLTASSSSSGNNSSDDSSSGGSSTSSEVGDTTAMRHAKFTSAAIKGLTKLKQCYDEIPNDPIVHCIEFYIALLKEPPRSPMLTSLTSSSSSSVSSSMPSLSSDESPNHLENGETLENKDEADEAEEADDNDKKVEDKDKVEAASSYSNLWSESKEVLIYRLLIEAENQDEQKNYSTVTTLIKSIDLLLADADRELERAVKKK